MWILLCFSYFFYFANINDNMILIVRIITNNNSQIHLINLMRISDALNMSEVHLKMALAAQNANIHIENLSVDEFFSK